MKIILCLLYFLKDAALIAAFICLIKLLFPVSQKRKHYLIAVYAVLIAAADVAGILNPLSYTTQQYEILDIVSFAFFTFSAFFLLQKPPVKKTLAVAVVSISTIDMLWSFIGSFLPFEADSDTALIFECAVDIVLSLIIIIVYIILTQKKLTATISYAAGKFPPWLIFALFIFEFACYYKEFGYSELLYKLSFSLSACMMVGCVIGLFFIVQGLLNKQNEMLSRLSEQLSYTENIRAADEELRAFRHDIKNHIIVLRSLFEKGEYDLASDYFDKLCKNTAPLVNRFSTGNSVIDSLLTVKSESCPVEFEGAVPEGYVDAQALCIILGNLLDNAVRACIESELPKELCVITIKSWIRNEALVIKISNPTNEYYQEKKVFRRIETSKKDKRNHGFGLANVRKAVAENNGILELSSEKGIFTASVILKGE